MTSLDSRVIFIESSRASDYTTDIICWTILSDWDKLIVSIETSKTIPSKIICLAQITRNFASLTLICSIVHVRGNFCAFQKATTFLEKVLSCAFWTIRGIFALNTTLWASKAHFICLILEKIKFRAFCQARACFHCWIEWQNLLNRRNF